MIDISNKIDFNLRGYILNKVWYGTSFPIWYDVGGKVFYNIIEQISGDAWDYVNLPILALPLENYVSCSICELWINPKKWGTTPATWASAPNADFRTWIND